MKTDLRKAEKEEKGRKGQKQVAMKKNNESSHTVQGRTTSLTPTKGEREEEQHNTKLTLDNDTDLWP